MAHPGDAGAGRLRPARAGDAPVSAPSALCSSAFFRPFLVPRSCRVRLDYTFGPPGRAGQEYHDIDKLPHSLDRALEALEVDHDYLTEGDVFTPDLIATWIDYKRENEIVPMRMRPHP